MASPHSNRSEAILSVQSKPVRPRSRDRETAEQHPTSKDAPITGQWGTPASLIDRPSSCRSSVSSCSQCQRLIGSHHWLDGELNASRFCLAWLRSLAEHQRDLLGSDGYAGWLTSRTKTLTLTASSSARICRRRSCSSFGVAGRVPAGGGGILAPANQSTR